MIGSPTLGLIGRGALGLKNAVSFIALLFINRWRLMFGILFIGLPLITALGSSLTGDFTKIKEEGHRLLRIDDFIDDETNKVVANEYFTTELSDMNGFEKFWTFITYYYDLLRAVWVYIVYIYIVWWLFNASPLAPNTSGRLLWGIVAISLFLLVQGYFNYLDLQNMEVSTIGETIRLLNPIKGFINFWTHFPDIIYPFTNSLSFVTGNETLTVS